MASLLLFTIKKLPSLPGVYFFKDEHQEIVYIGKAKNLKNRVSSYLVHQKTDWKAAAILAESTSLDYHLTKNELEALLLEAKLVQSHQPKFNTLLKTGQPFIYLMLTKDELPELVIVRNKKKRGTYFGPFIEKFPARQVYTFLINTFNLKICKKKILNGCLYYHLGKCSGSCRSDFNKEKYLERLQLAAECLRKGHKKFIEQLDEQIALCNKNLEFEKSKELNEYRTSFQRVFQGLNTNFSEQGATRSLFEKDIWILTADAQTLFVFKERNGVLKKQYIFYRLFESDEYNQDAFRSYYHTYTPSETILINFDLKEKTLLELFLREWTGRQTISIIKPSQGHLDRLIQVGQIQAQQYIQNQTNAAQALKKLLNLSKPIETIDCFDISHKQGTAMVGSCVRFTKGQPDKAKFRHFHIKTVEGQDDYESLREIVSRRYKHGDEPDLVLIDGGKGQLNAVKDLVHTHIASLAKREETIFSEQFPEGKKITPHSYAEQLLIALRDYAHHFAISFHRKTAEKNISDALHKD